MESQRVTVLTCEDVGKKFGMDRQYTFALQGDASFESVYGRLKNHLD